LIVSSEKFSIELLVLFLDIRFSVFAMAEFPICITPSQRELARMTEEERLTALLQVKERKKAVKAKPKKILGGPLMVNRMKMTGSQGRWVSNWRIGDCRVCLPRACRK